jgi:hypothetical protein
MSAEGTLIIVKQMYDVACLPRMVETEAGMSNIINSLKHFCSSPDSRVRFYACLTVSALSKSYNELLKTTHAEWISTLHKNMALGINEGDLENSKVLLEALKSFDVTVDDTDNPETAARTPEEVDATVEPAQDPNQDDEVEDKVPDHIIEKRKDSLKINTILFRLQHGEDDASDINDTDCVEIQTALVKISGVVSAFINADFLVLTVRGPLRQDPVFVDEVSVTVQQVTKDVVSAVLFDDGSAQAPVESTNAESELEDASYLDDDDRLAARAGAGGKGKTGSAGVFNYFSASSSFGVNGLSSIFNYAKDMEVVEFDSEEVTKVKEEVKEVETKKKLSLFKRLFW